MLLSREFPETAPCGRAGLVVAGVVVFLYRPPATMESPPEAAAAADPAQLAMA